MQKIKRWILLALVGAVLTFQGIHAESSAEKFYDDHKELADHFGISKESMDYSQAGVSIYALFKNIIRLMLEKQKCADEKCVEKKTQVVTLLLNTLKALQKKYANYAKCLKLFEGNKSFCSDKSNNAAASQNFGYLWAKKLAKDVMSGKI